MFENMTPIQQKVIFAALLAMTQDNHGAQDNLIGEEWDEADKMYEEIKKIVDES